MYNIIITAILVVAFFMSILSFLFGMRVQKSISNGIIPKLDLNPLKPITEAIEQHKSKKEETKLTDELTDIMGATRESMLQSITKERLKDG